MKKLLSIKRYSYVFNTRPWFDANRFAFAQEFKEKLELRNSWERLAFAVGRN